MTEQHAQDQVLAFATAALKVMDERRIAPTPNNFTVWYSYFCGNRPDLNRALEIMLDSGCEFTPERNSRSLPSTAPPRTRQCRCT